jgi:hypothetical protein
MCIPLAIMTAAGAAGTAGSGVEVLQQHAVELGAIVPVWGVVAWNFRGLSDRLWNWTLRKTHTEKVWNKTVGRLWPF